MKDKIYKINQMPAHLLPVGMKPDEMKASKLQLVPVNVNAATASKELLNHLLAVSFTSVPEQLIMTNVAGFVLVTEVNSEEQRITLLSPQPKPLPDTCFLLSDIVYVDEN